MTPTLSTAAASACPQANAPTKAHKLIAAARRLLPALETGNALDARMLRAAMTDAFKASDAEGAWVWKDAYEAAEAAAVLFLQKYGAHIASKSGTAARQLAMIEKLAALLPSHTRRSEESDAWQQFSTPLGLGFVVRAAAQLRAGDVVLEPSAGTGLLAVHAYAAGARLILNERAETRTGLLADLYSGCAVTAFDGEQIDDHLDSLLVPSVVLMNPPFSASAYIEKRMADATRRHIRSALARLQMGGRLVAITGASFDPAAAPLDSARLVFQVSMDGQLYARHGTSTDTRLLVIDKVAAAEGMVSSIMVSCRGHARSTAELLQWIEAEVPPRGSLAPIQPPASMGVKGAPVAKEHSAPPLASEAPLAGETDAAELRYSPRSEDLSEGAVADRLYEPYRVQTIDIEGARPHPTKLVQSAAMASVAAPLPSYRPLLPPRLVEDGILSDAQLETIIYAGEAHSATLEGRYIVDESYDTLALAGPDAANAVSFRKGFFLGDGTGSGKGRQGAGIILDNWLRGRRKAVWVSKSDKLIEDAMRDWAALGQEKLLIAPQSRFRQGTPIRMKEGILFTTYATLRSSEREGKSSRLRQILDWLGSDPQTGSSFEGVILFDEAHALANAAGDKGERGAKAASQQGLAGLRLQHALPHARVVYISATGATTVHNLAYAQRLGLWGAGDFPFANRADFVAAVEAGGIATMEVLARDLKSLGLYIARSLSYDGIEVEIVEHELTAEQIAIYDTYASAFAVIHHNLEEALKAANVTGEAGTLNGRAKAAAKSAFEGNKQRFFNHLITAKKTPTLIRNLQEDLAHGFAPVIQLVSTGESLMERRLAEIPTEEWADLSIDVTPREYVLDYLKSGFPVQLYERYADENGTLQSRPVTRDGEPVLCREAVQRRDRMIEQLASLPPVQTALDQIIHYFGTGIVAEVTGRSRRIVKTNKAHGAAVLSVENRPGSANLAEAQSFMDDVKRILVFSDAGGTGRSYHADLSAKNQRKRVHYLLEPGWKADTAIQGLGRSNRTNQAQPPLFRPVATNVRGEKRFLSTIAKRLDTLGAITRGQRQTGGQGLFRPEDNLESPYAKAALIDLYKQIYQGAIPFCSLGQFEEATGLRLTGEGGTLLDELPPITTFLNRLLALTIDLQNRLFEIFETLLGARIEGAIEAGIYDAGLETLIAESLKIEKRQLLHTHEKTGATTSLLTIRREDKNVPLAAEGVLDMARTIPKAELRINASSGRATLVIPAASLTLDDGAVETRVRLIRPFAREMMQTHKLEVSHWQHADEGEFVACWGREIDEAPKTLVSEVHIVTGLLLPVWKLLPQTHSKVYRLQTDDGEKIIGRLIPAAQLPDVSAAFGLASDRRLTPAECFDEVMAAGRPLPLRGGFALKRSLVMGEGRLELTGFTHTDIEQLKSFGLFSEISSWRLRLFIPAAREAGLPILERLLGKYPPLAVSQN
jgi:predicted RNA methylase